jgi:hypothetical protein
MSYQQQPPPFQAYPPGPPPVAPRKSRNWPWILAAVAAVIVALGVIAGDPNSGDTSGTASDQPASATPAAAAKEPVKPAGPARSMDGGVYQVGVDVQAGRYKTPGPPADDAIGMCYWSRNKDDSGEFESLIANGVVEGRGSVTVNKGEFVEITGGCTWTKVG